MSLVPVVTLLLLLEGTAWLVDARTGFRQRFLDAFNKSTISTEPIGFDNPLPNQWPDNGIEIRDSQDHFPPGERRPYVVAGKTIAASEPMIAMRMIQPENLVTPGKQRVFIIGESAAFGFPYTYLETFASKLRGPELAVFNASQVGWTSGKLVPVAHRISDLFQPDVLIVFMGNNEWFHWDVMTPPLAQAARSDLVRLLAHSRFLAAVEWWSLQRAMKREKNPSVGFVIHKELSGSDYALENPLERYTDQIHFQPNQWPQTKARYLQVFRENLLEIVQHAQSRGVRVVLLTMPINHRLSPAWKQPQPESFDPLYRDAVRERIANGSRRLHAKDFAGALEDVDAAIKLDPLPPLLHYLRGEALEGLGRPQEAEEAYLQCRERMIGNLGSMLSINRTIAEVAKETGADLLDVQQLFNDYEHAQGHYFNEDLIHDDCHPTAIGHDLIADALKKKLMEKPTKP